MPPRPLFLPLIPDAPADVKLTPMMAQYIEIKVANPDCLLFYRMGDFYELFFGDAEIASRALGIVLTKRGKHLGEDIAMCGVPVERADDYLQRLIALGHRIAVCEQLEDPAEARKRGPKSVVRRDVVRLVTPGTITEEQLLEPGRANILLALARVQKSTNDWHYGIAATDISTGTLQVCDADFERLPTVLARFDAREIVAGPLLLADAALKALLQETGAALAPAGRETGAGEGAERRIMEYYGVATLEGFGALSRAEIAATATLLAYVSTTQLATPTMLERPRKQAEGDFLEIDAATRANLELTRTMAGASAGSLLSELNICVTAEGSRLMAERLAQPLARLDEILSRQDSIACFVDQAGLRESLRGLLRHIPDFSRALQRLTLQRGGPRDLMGIQAGMAFAHQIFQQLQNVRDLPPEMQQVQAALACLDMPLQESLRHGLEDEVPLKARDGQFIRSSFAPELAQARALRDTSRTFIAALQARYAEQAEIRQLKIKHNNFLGYFIEVPQIYGERLMREPLSQTFIHRQTMSDAMRFTTLELGELDTRISSAGEQALALEMRIFGELSAKVLAHGDVLKAAARALAVLDVSIALAQLAASLDWVRPKVDHSLAFNIEAGRHVVVEAALRKAGKSFVTNACQLSNDTADAQRLAVVTGPNMAGKSTFLRQNALILVLAQMGSFVPARVAHIGIVDRLFSRVGAADDLARGRSTFMVEMVETSAILNQATPRSLVILDEIGRGTATFDGLSIAWAAMEHLHNVNQSRALFATHFHELTQLSGSLERLVNLTMRVTEFDGEVVFLHEVAHGAADRSYGIQVAKLAGLPPNVIARARHLLAGLEAHDRRAPVAEMAAEMPLFVADAPSALLTLIDQLAPDDLSPKAALEAIYAVKRLRAEERGRK